MGLASWPESPPLNVRSVIMIFTCCCLLRSFFTDTRYFWLGCTEFPPCNYEVSRGLRLLYALELGYYVQVG